MASPLAFAGNVVLLAGNGNQGDFARVGTPNLELVPFDKASAVVTDAEDRVYFLEPARSRIGVFSAKYVQADSKAYRVVSKYVELPYRRLQGMIRYKGDLLVSDGFTHRIYRIDAAQKVTVFAGLGTAGFSGDGGLALNARFDNPIGLAVDSAGNVFVADSNNQVIRRIDAGGVISTYAGTPQVPLDTGAVSGDGALAIKARLQYPRLVVVDSADRLMLIDDRYQIRRVNKDGVLVVAVGDGSQAYNGEQTDATKSALGLVSAMVKGPDGLIYYSDTTNHRIRRLNGDGSIATMVGSGQSTGFPQYDSKPLTSVVGAPTAIAFNPAGNLIYYAEANFRWQEALQK